MNANNRGKLEYLNSVEDFRPAAVDVDHSKKSHLVTFPYPYMNGKLHLGHLFTLSKADFVSYFKKQQGYNALFPFGFHCTGMPISASAYKLKEELAGRPVDVSIVGMLRGLGFSDVEPFTDPVHWVRTFPGYAIDSLKKFHANIDWRRTFITTDINPYYDSFVRYQFNKLKSLNLLNFGKRYSIYCPIDNQPCLDHDRRKGEGIKPECVILRKIEVENKLTLLIRCKDLRPVEKIVFFRGRKVVHFRVGEAEYLIEDDLFQNLKFQVDGVKVIKELCISDLRTKNLKVELIEKDVPGKVVAAKPQSPESVAECEEYKRIVDIKNEQLVLVATDNFVKIFVPEDTVISRSGAKCVVSLLDQWYIDYSIPEWKDKARKCVERMVLTDDTRAKINEHLEGLNKWGFSRSFGLGTRVPWDPQYLIDSLSDSTIYNAFYTVKHLLFSDIEGNEELFPKSELGDDVWKFIFGDIDTLPSSLAVYEDILKSCRESFEYFYPVDVRVSGKDLIGNHLLFFIFNHVALFDEKYWPRSIFSNGHLMLNSAKMSKSDNNFLTVEDCLSKYGASATRMCLAECGDTNEDANFLETVANSFVLKLYTLTKTVESLESAHECDEKLLCGMVDKMALASEDRRMLFVNEMFLQSVSRNAREALKSHEKMVFRDVVKYGFHECINLMELYRSLGGCNSTLVNLGYRTILSLMYPIVPSLANYLLKLKFQGDLSIPKSHREEQDKIKAIEHVRSICSRINSMKRDSTFVEIGVTNEYPEWKRECMRIVDGCDQKPQITESVDCVFKRYGIRKDKGMIFCMDYFEYKEKYVVSFDELDVLSMFADFIEESCDLGVCVVEGEQGEPLSPTFRFSKSSRTL